MSICSFVDTLVYLSNPYLLYYPPFNSNDSLTSLQWVLLTTLFLHLKNRFLKLLLSIQKRRIDLWESWDDVLHFRSIALMVHGSKYPFRGSGLKRDPGRPDHLFWGEFSSHFVSIFSCQIDKVILDVRCLVSLLSLTTNVIITTVVHKVREEGNIMQSLKGRKHT